MALIEFPAGKRCHIGVVKDIIPSDVCKALIAECVRYYDKLFYPGTTMSGISPHVKLSMDFNFSPTAVANLGVSNEVFEPMHREIDVALRASIAAYVDEYPELAYAPRLYDSDYRLQHYPVAGGYYRRHYDGSPWDSGSLNRRVLGVVMYLNTVERGGETGFPEHDVKVPAIAGDVAVFPAAWTHPHRGCCPISNSKWMISSFILTDRIQDRSPMDFTANEGVFGDYDGDIKIEPTIIPPLDTTGDDNADTASDS